MTEQRIPGIKPDTVAPVPFDSGLATGSGVLALRAPYGGALLGKVPLLTAANVDLAVAVAKHALHDQLLLQWRRAQTWAGDCARLPRGAEADQPNAVLRNQIGGLLIEAGLPADYLHLVTGGGGTVGNALVDHHDVAAITFTGSPEVGCGIRARASRKRVGLELGNNAPVITEPDGDSPAAAAKIKMTDGHCLTNSGDCSRGAIVDFDATRICRRLDRGRIHRRTRRARQDTGCR